MGVKISELNEATSAQNSDVLPIVQNGETKKIQSKKLFDSIGSINVTTVTTTSEIPQNTNYTIPLNYQVGNNSLEISYMGERLINGTHYIEVGNTGEVSNTIQFYNWGQAVPTGRTIEFIVRGVYE